MNDYIRVHFDKDDETILQEKKDLGMETYFYIISDNIKELSHKTFDTYEEAEAFAEAANFKDYEIVED